MATKVDMEELAAQFGWSYNLFMSDPGLKKLLQNTVDKGWTEARFTAELRNTGWYKKHGEAARKTILLQKTDPKEFQRRTEQLKQHIRDTYFQINGGKGLSDAFVNTTASQAMTLGWTEEELKHHITTGTTLANIHNLMDNDTLGGQAEQAEMDIRKTAADYGVTVSDDYVANRIRNMMIGNDSIEAVKGYMQTAAKSRYHAFADQIDQGATVRDIAEQYMQSMSKVLEVPNNAISIFDKHIQGALTKVDTHTGKPNPEPIWQFEQGLRNDPRWKKTQGAQDALMGVGHSLLQQFGVVS